jgi:excisionase family DNA binding protein
MDELLTVKQVAELLQLHEMTIRRYIKSGKLEAVRIGRNVRVPRRAVEALLHAENPALREAPPIYRAGDAPPEEAIDESWSNELLFSGLTMTEWRMTKEEAMSWKREMMLVGDAKRIEKEAQDPLLQLAGVISLDEPLDLDAKLDDYIAEAIWREFREGEDAI